MGFDIKDYKVPDGIDTDTFKNVVSAAYTAWVGNRGVVPTVQDVSQYCRHTKKIIAKVMDTKEFEFAIKARGVNWKQEKGLSTKQMLALSVLTNPSDRRDLRAKLRSIGATHVEYQAWLREPLFRNRVDTLAEQMLGDNMSSVHQALVNRATGGDTRAIQLYYELTGRHDPAQKQVVELTAIIGMLLEVLTKNITDTQLLDRISDDIARDIMPKMVTGTVIKELE